MIRVERHADSRFAGVAEIVLDRPQKRNALTPQMLHDLSDAANRLGGDDSARVILLRGEGGIFCAGFDLSLCRDDPAVLGEMLRGLWVAMRALRAAPTPVVIAAQGAAIAGGCALLAAGDIVITHASARLGYPVVSLGISPAVNAPMLARAVGPRAARQATLDPGLIDGVEAARLGLADRCVDIPEDVIPRSQIIAAELAGKPPGAMAATKRWLNQVDASDDLPSAERALDASLALVGSAEERARLARLWA